MTSENPAAFNLYPVCVSLASVGELSLSLCPQGACFDGHTFIFNIFIVM
jgi:hypothetical protein